MIMFELLKRKGIRLYPCQHNQLDDPWPFKIMYTNVVLISMVQYIDGYLNVRGSSNWMVVIGAVLFSFPCLTGQSNNKTFLSLYIVPYCISLISTSIPWAGLPSSAYCSIVHCVVLPCLFTVIDHQISIRWNTFVGVTISCLLLLPGQLSLTWR